MASFEVKASNRVAQGVLKRIQHTASSLGGTPTIFAIYEPDACKYKKLPVVYWLSGLTCTDENFSQKAGAFQAACDNEVVLVMPDTSPRGEGVPDEEPHVFDFGVGAGFYLNATTEKYKKHYNMYDYVVQELPAFVEKNFPVTGMRSISGHSMGGHGALTIALKNPDRYTSVSAFAPICNPMNVPWGQKAFKLYLGDDKAAAKQYDATELIKSYKGRDLHILCDQGTADNFLIGDVNQLQPLTFMAAAQEAKVHVTFRLQAGYDHSYYFMSSFIAEHIAHHARFLHAREGA
jgi:S-formylglutathione hydrolase